MVLRAENCNSSSSSLSTTALSHLVELPIHWHEAISTPMMDWDRGLDLFQVAVMAKFSISITELIRDVTEQTPRVHALLGDMNEDPANKKIVSVKYLSLGEAVRKQCKDKYPYTILRNLKVRELLQLTTDCFQIKRNRIIDRRKSFQGCNNQENRYNNSGIH